MKRHFLLISIFVSLSLGYVFSQEKITLYPNGVPDNNGITEPEIMYSGDFVINVTEARMYAYPAPKEKTNGTAVLICPGGAYFGLSTTKEGEEIAKWFNELGVSAFVLYYRMPNGHHQIPLEDAQTAFGIIRKNAKKWNIDKNKIGVMGFSAGGHLAATVGTLFKNKKERPAFMILAYPVITMDDKVTHKGSRNNLLGEYPSEDLIKYYSPELQITRKTPPTFILHSKNDNVVPIENSELIFKALQNKKVSAEFQIFDEGGHGFGMRKYGLPVDNWDQLLKAWLIKQRII